VQAIATPVNRATEPASGTPPSGEPRSKDLNIRARVFDADRRDEVLELEQALRTDVTPRQLLWIDIEGNLDEEEGERFAKRFALEWRTRRALQRALDQPFIGVHGEYVHVRVAAEPDPVRSTTAWLDIIAGENVVITSHQRPIGFLVDFDDRIEADTNLGTLGSATFLAALLDADITSYHAAVDRIEDEVDVLDTHSLGDDSRRGLLNDLVALRRRIARLRRLLADHRAVFAALASPDLAGIPAGDDGRAALTAVSSRFDGAMGAVEDSREVLLGSFEVYMTRTAQRTNEVMKVLTLATVLLLPGSMVAGLLGMNVIVPLDKDNPMSFWFVVIAIAVLAAGIIMAARARRWL
jgi:Mg2+ and Co2+ transporter CorA